jgi:ankyrin repeat protein
LAAERGHFEVLIEILNRGASVEITDIYGNTLLRGAAANKLVEIVTKLQNRFGRVDITDAFNNTNLSAAAANSTRERDELINDVVLLSQRRTYQVSFRNLYLVAAWRLNVLHHIRHTFRCFL